MGDNSKDFKIGIIAYETVGIGRIHIDDMLTDGTAFTRVNDKGEPEVVTYVENQEIIFREKP